MIKSSDGLKYCSNDGFLVGESHWIPDAAFDNHQDGSRSIIGCNQVFCSKCNEFVRQRRGYSLKPYSLADQIQWAPALFASENWDELPFVQKGNGRQYFCACHSLPVTNSIAMDGSDDHLIYGALQPETWKCKGHPLFRLPTEIYGLPLIGSDDFKVVVTAVLEHRASILDPLPSDEINPEAFLIGRLYALIEKQADRKHADDLLAEFLSNKAPIYRSVACVLIAEFPSSAAAPRLLSAYRDHPQLFEDVQHPHHPKVSTPGMRLRLIGLDEQFQVALIAFLKYSQSPEAKALLRELVLSGKTKTIWGNAANEIGSEWIDAHLFEIFSRDPKKSLYSLIPYGAEGDTPQILERARKLLEMKILPEEEFLDSIPAKVKMEIQPKAPHVRNPKSRKK